jgi:hypothetical protein
MPSAPGRAEGGDHLVSARQAAGGVAGGRDKPRIAWQVGVARTHDRPGRAVA